MSSIRSTISRLHRLRAPGAWAALLLAALLAASGPFVSANPKGDIYERGRAGNIYRAPGGIYSDQLAFGSNPRFSSSYHPDADAIVATAGDIEISEQDLYCFLLATAYPNPTIYEGYKLAKSPREAFNIEQEIERIIQAMVLTQRLAAKETGSLSDLDAKRVQIRTMTAWQAVWTRRSLEPKIQLKEVDLVREYRNSEVAEVFYRSPSARIRVITLTIDPIEMPEPEELDELSLEEADELLSDRQLEYYDRKKDAVNELNELRAKIVAGELDFKAAASEYNDQWLADRQGLIPEVRDNDLAPQLRNIVFQAKPGDITPVATLPTGAVFALVESLTPEGYLSYEEAREGARELARQRAAKFMFNRELRFLSPWRQKSDTRTWDGLPPHEVILEVDDFTLTKREILKLYPAYEQTDTLTMDKDGFRFRSEWLAASLCVRQRAIEDGLADDPIITTTRRMAENITRAQVALKKRLKDTTSPDDAEISKFYDENPELFVPVKRSHIVMVNATLAPEIPNAERAIRSRRLLEEFIATCRIEASEAVEGWMDDFQGTDAARELGLVAGPQYIEGEENLTYDLDKPQGTFPYAGLVPFFNTIEGSINVTDYGYIFPAEAPGLIEQIGDTPLGEFSPIQTIDGNASSFIVLAEQAPDPVDKELLKPFAARELALAKKAKIVSDLLDIHAGDTAIRYAWE